MSRKKYETSADRIRANSAVDEDSGCWIWQRRLNRGGYGVGNHFIGGERKAYRAHRLAYEAFVGPVPEGLDLDHLCRTRACCNPDHLEPVSRRTNLTRSPLLAARVNAAKTHCKRGHEFTPENTNTLQGRVGRWCRACGRVRAYEYRQRQMLRAAGIEAAA